MLSDVRILSDFDPVQIIGVKDEAEFRAYITTWDWKGSPERKKVNEGLQFVGHGAILYEVDTGSDSGAYMVAPAGMTDAEAQDLYDEIEQLCSDYRGD